MAFGDRMSCDCCHEPTGPPFCAPTWCLKDCTGAPIGGASISFSCPAFNPFDLPCDPPPGGLTGDGGCFTGADLDPYPGPPNYFEWDIDYDGANRFGTMTDGQYMTLRHCSGLDTIDLCYYKLRATIHVEAAADVHVLADDPGNLLYIPGLGFPSITGEGTGSIVIEWKRIIPCGTLVTLPASFSLELVPFANGYRSACVEFTLDCLDDIEIETVWHNSLDCYFDPQFRVGATYPYFIAYPCAPDLGCTYGPGPNYRGFISKKFELTFNSASGTDFGADEGSPILLTGVPTFDGGGTFQGFVYEACGGGAGQYLSYGRTAYFGGVYTLNTPAPNELQRVPFSSARVSLSCYYVRYYRFGAAGCANKPCTYINPPFIDMDEDNNMCHTLASSTEMTSNFGLPGGFVGGLGAPCDKVVSGYTFTSGLINAGPFTVRIREVC
jgi:hypothetical protein